MLRLKTTMRTGLFMEYRHLFWTWTAESSSREAKKKKICTFLSINGISFRYEQPYFKNTATEFKRQYRPDFTIYFQQNGRPVFVVLEHFGIDAYGNVPGWFGEGKRGGFYEANEIYNEGIKWKRAINRKYNTILLETTSAMFHDGTIYERLTQQLKQYGIPMRELTEDEKFEKLVKRNKRMEDSILQLITTFITLMKSNRHNPESVLNLIKKENNNPLFIERSEFMIHEIFQPIFDEYEKMLHENNQIDYTDLILKATDVCNSGLYKKEYDMILVDEFQDISVDRFELLQSLRNKRISLNYIALAMTGNPFSDFLVVTSHYSMDSRNILAFQRNAPSKQHIGLEIQQ